MLLFQCVFFCELMHHFTLNDGIYVANTKTKVHVYYISLSTLDLQGYVLFYFSIDVTYIKLTFALNMPSYAIIFWLFGGWFHCHRFFLLP
jgi:hypothetical protein